MSGSETLHRHLLSVIQDRYFILTERFGEDKLRAELGDELFEVIKKRHGDRLRAEAFLRRKVSAAL
jgi:hypothetical protein